MVIVLTIALVLLALCCLVAAFALARVAARADEVSDEHARQIRLNRLAAIRSPSGKRFFAAPEAAQELDEELATLSTDIRR